MFNTLKYQGNLSDAVSTSFKRKSAKRAKKMKSLRASRDSNSRTCCQSPRRQPDGAQPCFRFRDDGGAVEAYLGSDLRPMGIRRGAPFWPSGSRSN